MLSRRRQMTLVEVVCHGWWLYSTPLWSCMGAGKMFPLLQRPWHFWTTISPDGLLWGSPEKSPLSSSMFFGSTHWSSLHTFLSVFLFSVALPGAHIIQQRWEGIGHLTQDFQLSKTAWTIQKAQFLGWVFVMKLHRGCQNWRGWLTRDFFQNENDLKLQKLIFSPLYMLLIIMKVTPLYKGLGKWIPFVFSCTCMLDRFIYTQSLIGVLIHNIDRQKCILSSILWIKLNCQKVNSALSYKMILSFSHCFWQ